MLEPVLVRSEIAMANGGSIPAFQFSEFETLKPFIESIEKITLMSECNVKPS